MSDTIPFQAQPDLIDTIHEVEDRVTEATKRPKPLIAKIIEMGDPARQVKAVMDIFPGSMGVVKRILTYTYLYRVWAYDRPEINPRVFPVNLMGEGGFGKSADVYTWARELGMECITTTLAGVSDFESVNGVVYPSAETKRTEFFANERLPLDHELDRYGIMFVDDINRGEANALNPMMEFVNTGRYNHYALPKHFGIVAASNPQGRGHKVKSLDVPQMTRFVNLPVDPNPEVLLDQLARQGVPSKLYAYHAKFTNQLEEIAQQNRCEIPEPRPLNWRNITGHAVLSRWLQHDRLAMQRVSYAIFGASFMAQLENLESGDYIIDPQEILDTDYTTMQKRVKGLIDRQKDDILSASVEMLTARLNDSETNLSKDQLDNVCEFLMVLPEGTSLHALRRLVMESAARHKHYRPLLMLWRSKDGVTAGPLGDHFLNLTQRTMSEVYSARAELNAA